MNRLIEKKCDLVSIIVITYNSEKYVVETLDSTRNQSYKNIELIISDDNSTDNTLNICRNWVAENKDKFISVKILKAPENTGIPSNCNRGVKAAEGTWVKIIAGDDVLKSTCIDKNLNFAIESGSPFVYSEVKYFSENGYLYADDTKDKDLRIIFSKLGKQDKLKFYSRFPIFLNTPSWFIKKEKIVLFDEEFKFLEDQPFVFNMLNEGCNLSFLDEVTVEYRKHEESVQKRNKFITNDFIYCYEKYRKKNLNFFSLRDLSFILNFHIDKVMMKSPSYLLIRLLLIPVRKLNPVSLFKIEAIK